MSERDIAEIKAGIAEVKADILKWKVGAIGFQTVATLGTVIALVRIFAKRPGARIRCRRNKGAPSLRRLAHRTVAVRRLAHRASSVSSRATNE